MRLELLVHAIVLQVCCRDSLIHVEVVDPDDVNALSCLYIEHGAICALVSCVRAILIKIPQPSTILGCQLSFYEPGLSLYHIGPSVEVVGFALLVNL